MINNLTLLTGELNASASNGPFPEKVRKIVADSDLRLNAWLRDAPPAQWNEASIGERAGNLFDIARQIWLSPPARPAAASMSSPHGPTGADSAPD